MKHVLRLDRLQAACMDFGLAHRLIRMHFGCRYRDVPKADLGLTAAEVFALSDKELNQVRCP